GASSVAAYNPVTDTWTTKASMPKSRVRAGAALGPDGRIYVFGGNLSNGHNGNDVFEGLSPVSVDVYDPATNSWSSGPPMSGPRDALAVAGPGADGQIYLF